MSSPNIHMMMMAWTLFLSAVLILQHAGVDGATADISLNPFVCQFMFFDPLCQKAGLGQVSNVGRHWKMLGAPETKKTGPQEIYTKPGMANNDIMYANYDSPSDGLGKPGDQEALLTPIITTNGPACVSFVYYMYGPDLGKLYTVIKYGDNNPGYDKMEEIDANNVRINANVVEKLIASGEQGKQWIRKQFQVANNGQTKFQVFFQVYRGNGQLSNIGLDDIIVSNDLTNCPIEDAVTNTGCASNPCHANAGCRDLSSGNFECTCNTGFAGNGVQCTDIIECANNPCHADATCTNTVGSFTCACNSGFFGDGLVCSASAGIDCNALVDLVFVLDASGNARDVFHEEKNFIKQIASVFVNPQSRFAVVAYADDPLQAVRLGAYTNLATFKTAVDGITFIDGPSRLDRALGTTLSEFATAPRTVDAQVAIILNAGSTDAQRATSNSIGVSMRSMGQKLKLIGIGSTVDVSELTGIAGGDSSKVFLASTVSQLFGADLQRRVVDNTCPSTLVDECLNNPCHANAACTDTVASFECKCNIGYQGNGIQCTDINECSTNPCNQFADCRNTVGSFECTCRTGFTGNGLVCTDINECAVSDCHADATCANTVGSYICACRSGYRGDGKTCLLQTAVKNCDSIVDLVFLLDASDAGTTFFQAQKEFIKTVAGTYLGQTQSRAGVVSYGHDPHPVMPLNTYTDIATFNAAVDRIPSIGGKARMDRSLGTVISQFATSPRTITQATIAFVLNAGRTDGQRNTQVSLGTSMRALGYPPVLIGVGPTVDPTELNDIAASADRVILAPTTAELLSDNVMNRLQGLTCPQVNECDSNPCHAQATCRDTPTSYECTCNTGYQGDGKTCTDINECGQNVCHINAICTNTVGSYTCRCRTGFTGDGRTCTDINECANNPCDVNANCLNTVGSFTCTCRTGFTGNGLTCTDINECANNPCDTNAACLNIVGSFTCSCRTGFTGNGLTCTDINECANNPCDVNANCLNIVGSFTCTCRTGFTGNGLTCSDVNECANNPCDVNANCLNTVNSFTCTCKTGFTGNGLTCTDVNECSTNPCNVDATCTNIPGSFRCTCNVGLIGDGKVCTKSLVSCTTIVDLVFLLDSSDHGRSIYQDQKNLIKTIAATFLVQKDTRAAVVSYAHDPKQEIRLGNYVDATTFNAAVDNIAYIGGNARMDRSLGTVLSEFATSPRPGVSLAQVAILLNAGRTEGQRSTQNSLGHSMRALGYKFVIIGLGDKVDQQELIGIGGGNTSKVFFARSTSELITSGAIQRITREACPAINECDDKPCHPQATCTDTLDSYECKCNTGFTGDGKLQCTDINECLTNPCHQFATCLNTVGSFECTCRPGFTGNGFVCTDVNECLNNPCHQFADCRNNVGSFECTCRTGYTGNGLVCTDINECANNPCHQFATCGNTQGSFTCTCNTGYQGNGFVCTDINECANNPCHQFGSCRNTPGSFQCTCNTGYSGNGFTCTDINECLNDPCHQHATCRNIPGSFVCTCRNGFTGNGLLCTDINECLTQPCHVNATCTNTVGSYRCTCRQGFRGDGLSCSAATTFCKYVVDLVFLLDASKHAAGMFEREKELIKTVASAFLTQASSRAAVVAYADDPKPEVKLKDYTNMATFNAAVDRLQFIGGNARIDRALGTGLSEFTTNPRTGSISQIAILLSAGASDGQRSTQRSLGISMRALGYKLFVAGISNTINVDELMEIAGGNNTFLILPSSINDLFGDTMIKRMVHEACPEVNECLTNPCHPNAFCTDTIRSYTCQCNVGYTGDGRTCTDINECLNNPCPQFATCRNTPGSYQCTCNPGFVKDGNICRDVNECLTSPCHQFATCTNTPGAYLCNCDVGYEGNGTFCMEMRYRDWGAWSTCSVTCGGTRKRQRECSVSKITYPHACPGKSEEVNSCDTKCHIPNCPDHNAGQFYSFEDTQNKMLHGINTTWVIAQKTPTIYTGPANDHTFGSGCGHFIFFEASKCPPDAFGFLETPPQLPKSQQYCIKFYLSMYSALFPDQMGSLTLYLFQYQQATKHVFHHSGITSNDRNLWREVNVDLFLSNTTMPFGVQFMAEQGSSFHSDIAIDDIAFTPGGCTGPVDGNWGAWSNYGACNATCGTGYQVKRRTCSSPPPRNNGKDCVGDAEWAKPCDLVACKVNGVWTDWQQWSACSIACNKGRRYRIRECYNTRAKGNDDVICTKTDRSVAKEEEIWMDCSQATCRPEGTLYGWSKWSKCSVTCDYGLRYRTGKCSVIDGCSGILTQSAACALRACYVNRQYGDWGEWSKCSTSCGNGNQWRKRYCPLVKGCLGNNTEMRSCAPSKCHMSVCPRYPFGSDVYNFENGKKLIHTDPATWRIGQNRTYSVKVGPRGDATWQNYFTPECGQYIYYEASRRPQGHTGLISTQLRVPSRYQNCLSFYLNMYTTFTAEMGNITVSVHQRGLPLNQLYHHKGPFTPNINNWRNINLDIVLNDLRPFSVLFKADRGSGYHSDISVDDIVLYNGLCDGPVDGKWSVWSAYGKCSTTCGGGVQTRSRSCSTRNGGKPCDGDATMSQACNEQLCPVNGGWCEWSAWSECTKSCNGGTRKRVRECTGPVPVAPGLPCLFGNGTRGLHEETTGNCNQQVCDVDGNWGAWVEGSCSVTCNNGTYSRSRQCNDPAPVGQGRPCAVLAKEANVGGITITHWLTVQNENLPCRKDPCP